MCLLGRVGLTSSRDASPCAFLYVRSRAATLELSCHLFSSPSLSPLPPPDTVSSNAVRERSRAHLHHDPNTSPESDVHVVQVRMGGRHYSFHPHCLSLLASRSPLSPSLSPSASSLPSLLAFPLLLTTCRVACDLFVIFRFFERCVATCVLCLAHSPEATSSRI